MNRKADLSFQTVLIILAAATLLGAVVIFVGPTIKTATNFLDKFGFNFAADDATTETIDEERIDATTEIPIEMLAYDKESGLTVIIKQEYGMAWNFEVQKTAFDTFSEQYTGPGFLLVYLMSGEEEPQPILENKKLVEILNSDKLRGSISINGKTYIHTPSEHDFAWFEDTNNDGFYKTGEEIETEKLSQLILASKWEEATS